MSDEDSALLRIAPTFIDEAGEFRRYMEGDPKARLPKARWDEYRRIYAKNGIKLGIQRDSFGDAFIMVDSMGLLNRGHTTGYLHCVLPISEDENRFFPCRLSQEDGRRDFDPTKHQEAYESHRIDIGWFAYDEGPS
jgi:hypothetical protein